MEIPLKLKWLGNETGEICNLLAPFHPLIYISPAPQLHTADLPAGFIRLPHKICRVLDLRRTYGISALCPPSQDDLPCDVLDLKHEARSFAALYEFYFEVCLKNSALMHPGRTSKYFYLEQFHSDLVERRFIALVRRRHEDRTVAGLLLRQPTPVELQAYGARLGAYGSIGEADVAIVDVLFAGGGGKHLKSLVHQASEWLRTAGYSFLSSLPASALVISEHENEEDWTVESETLTVWPAGNAALLYCDLFRCSYLSNDIYYYSVAGDQVCLHYVANVLPRRSGILRLLDSTVDMEKRVYTRHAPVRATLSAAGVECEFVNTRNVPQVSNSMANGDG